MNDRKKKPLASAGDWTAWGPTPTVPRKGEGRPREPSEIGSTPYRGGRNGRAGLTVPFYVKMKRGSGTKRCAGFRLGEGHFEGGERGGRSAYEVEGGLPASSPSTNKEGRQLREPENTLILVQERRERTTRNKDERVKKGKRGLLRRGEGASLPACPEKDWRRDLLSKVRHGREKEKANNNATVRKLSLLAKGIAESSKLTAEIRKKGNSRPQGFKSVTWKDRGTEWKLHGRDAFSCTKKTVSAEGRRKRAPSSGVKKKKSSSSSRREPVAPS